MKESIEETYEESREFTEQESNEEILENAAFDYVENEILLKTPSVSMGEVRVWLCFSERKIQQNGQLAG
jgi:hypothetical protein